MKDSDPLLHQQRRARRPVSAITLKRSQGILGGVAGGMAKFTGAQPHVVRALFIVALTFSFGIFGLVYLVLWVLLPKE